MQLYEYCWQFIVCGCCQSFYTLNGLPFSTFCGPSALSTWFLVLLRSSHAPGCTLSCFLAVKRSHAEGDGLGSESLMCLHETCMLVACRRPGAALDRWFTGTCWCRVLGCNLLLPLKPVPVMLSTMRCSECTPSFSTCHRNPAPEIRYMHHRGAIWHHGHSSTLQSSNKSRVAK